MATEQASTGKTCAICGQDCSHRERVKDAAGRYYCKTCVEKKKKSAPKSEAPTGAPPPAPAPKAATPKPKAGAFEALEALAKFESTAEVIEEHGGACPHCRKPMPMGAIICTECGFNRRIGKQVSMKSVATAPRSATRGSKSVGKSAATQMPAFLQAEWMFFVGPMAVMLLLFGLAQVSEGLAIAYVAGVFLFGVVVGIATLIRAFKEGVVHFVVCLVCGVYMPIFVFFINDDKRLKYAYAASILGFTLMYALGLDQLNQILEQLPAGGGGGGES